MAGPETEEGKGIYRHVSEKKGKEKKKINLRCVRHTFALLADPSFSAYVSASLFGDWEDECTD